MAIENVVSLVDYEKRRAMLNYMPADEEVVRVGRAKMTFHHIHKSENVDEDDYLLETKLDNDIISIGGGKFTVGSDERDISIYDNMIIGDYARLMCDESILRIAGSRVDVYGTLDLSNGVLDISKGSMLRSLISKKHRGVIRFGKNNIVWSYDHDKEKCLPVIFIVGSAIIYAPHSMMASDGRHPAIDYVLHNEKDIVSIHNAATIMIEDPEQRRPATINDRIFDIHSGDPISEGIASEWTIDGIKRVIVKGEFKNYDGGNAVSLIIKKGDYVAGDLDLKIFRLNKEYLDCYRIVSGIIINEGAKLISDKTIDGMDYYEPKMVVGEYLEGVTGEVEGRGEGGNLVIKGEYYCNADLLIYDGEVIIEETGILTLGPSGRIKFMNKYAKLDIKGKLSMQHVRQISWIDTLDIKDMIDVDKKSHIIITNENYEEGDVLFRTPRWTLGDDLLNIFGNHFDNVEFHIPSGRGISLDSYPTDMLFNRDWYNGKTLVKAIRDGQIIWHDEAFIQIPYCYNNVQEYPIYDAVLSMFRTTSHTSPEKMQEVADAFRHAGAGNVVFKFYTNDGNEYTFRLVTHPPIIVAQEHTIATDKYFVKTDLPDNTEALLLLSNNVEHTDTMDRFKDPDQIVNIDKDKKEAQFKLDGKRN